MPSIELFDACTIDKLDWPNTNEGDYAKRYIEPIVKSGISTFISNLQSQMFALKIDQYVFPVIVANECDSNSYICSPYEHYISYGKDSIGLISNPIFSKMIGQALNVLGYMGRIGKMKSVVYVNHWLFSTDLYPEDLSPQHIATIVDYLQKLYPDHAIIFRSSNSLTSEYVQRLFKKQGFHLIPSRYVHITNPKNETLFATRIIKSDLKLWRESQFKVIDDNKITLDECSELLKLYNTLYIDQHSERNPKYTLHFIEHLFKHKLLHFKVLKLGECYKGVIGYYVKDGIMMCPFFGYDKTDPQHTVIYRMLSTALLLEAKEKGWIFHQSSGASFYKSVRRAQGCVETMAVYTRHLSRKQKFSWATLNLFVNLFGPKIMKRY